MSGRGQATGAGIEYGKVKIFSSDDSIDKLKETLDHILRKHHYPEEEFEDDGPMDPIDPVDVEEIPEVPQEPTEEESPWIKAKKQASVDKE